MICVRFEEKWQPPACQICESFVDPILSLCNFCTQKWFQFIISVVFKILIFQWLLNKGKEHKQLSLTQYDTDSLYNSEAQWGFNLKILSLHSISMMHLKINTYLYKIIMKQI